MRRSRGDWQDWRAYASKKTADLVSRLSRREVLVTHAGLLPLAWHLDYLVACLVETHMFLRLTDGT